MNKALKLFVLSPLVFSIVSCDDTEKKLYERAYELATIESFLGLKTTENNLLIHKYNVDTFLRDDNNYLFNLMYTLEYFEKSPDFDKSEKFSFYVRYDNYDTEIYFFNKQKTIRVNHIIDGHLYFVNAERYFYVADLEFDNLIQDMENLFLDNE